MPIYTDGQIIATIHDFKTNISKYIRMLQKGDYRAVVVRRYNETVGVFITNHSHDRFEQREQRRRDCEKQGDDWYRINDKPEEDGVLPNSINDDPLLASIADNGWFQDREKTPD